GRRRAGQVGAGAGPDLLGDALGVGAGQQRVQRQVAAADQAGGQAQGGADGGGAQPQAADQAARRQQRHGGVGGRAGQVRGPAVGDEQVGAGVGQDPLGVAAGGGADALLPPAGDERVGMAGAVLGVDRGAAAGVRFVQDASPLPAP